MMTVITAELLSNLAALDTPTVCNALEEIDNKFRDRGFTTEPLVCPFPNLKPVVGVARTGMIRSVRPNKSIGADKRVSYYEYVSKGELPRIAILQDLDGPNAGHGAFWGEVNSNVHKALGAIGVVTDGCIRDIPDWAEGFQALAGSIKPSHAHVHMLDFGCQVTVSGMVVEHDDLIHADQHGAVVVPKEVAGEVVAAAGRVAAKEKIILDLCKSQEFSFEKLKNAMLGPKDIH
jgi:regulator of RNase E activity RraA